MDLKHRLESAAVKVTKPFATWQLYVGAIVAGLWFLISLYQHAEGAPVSGWDAVLLTILAVVAASCMTSLDHRKRTESNVSPCTPPGSE